MLVVCTREMREVWRGDHNGLWTSNGKHRASKQLVTDRHVVAGPDSVPGLLYLFGTGPEGRQ